MSRHRELKSQRRKLTLEIEEIRSGIKRVEDNNKVYQMTLNNLEDDFVKSVDKAEKAALADEINKHTFKHTEILGKLQNKREEILTNRDKKLENITYEKYAKKAKNKLSIEDSVKRSEDIKQVLEEKIGKRLSSELSRIIPSYRSFNTLTEIQDAFDELELMSSKLGRDLDVMDRLEKIIFSYDTSEIQGNSSVIFIIVVLLIFIGLMFFMPILVVGLVLLFCYNLHKSLVYYDAMSIAKVLVSNVNKINNSIEEGIKNKVKSRRTEVENKFKLMLDKVDKKIETVEELISDTTAEVEADFNFNSSSIAENYKSRKDSTLEQIAKNNAQIDSYQAQIQEIENKIKAIDEEIAEEGKNIYDKYYPKSLSYEERSGLFLDDILLDIQDNEPVLHELPRGSAVYLYKDESSLLNFVNLYLCSLISRMRMTSIYLKLFDTKYAGTKLLEYSPLETFEVSLNKEMIKENIESLNQEMMKRIKIIGSKHIDEYNKEAIDEEGSPLAYYVIFDMFNKPSDSDSIQRQILINGFKYGLAYHLFLDIKEVEKDKKCLEFLLENYSEYYYISDSGVSKKSSKFVSSLYREK